MCEYLEKSKESPEVIKSWGIVGYCTYFKANVTGRVCPCSKKKKRKITTFDRM